MERAGPGAFSGECVLIGKLTTGCIPLSDKKCLNAIFARVTVRDKAGPGSASSR